MGVLQDLLEIGLSQDQAEDVLIWHEAESQKQAQITGGIVVIRLLDYLLNGHTDASVRLRLTALAFAYRLEHLAGYTSQREAAEDLGCTQQAISSALLQAKRAIEG
jgi:hypothetical protein